MKKIIFFALALLVLLGGGVGGWIMFGQKKAGEHVEEKPKPKGPPAYVPIGPIILPVIGETRVEQTVLLVVAIEVDGDDTKDKVRLVAPRLNDAFIKALYGTLGRDDVVEGQILDVGALRDKLMAAAEKVLGPGVAQDVLIQAVNQRPAI